MNPIPPSHCVRLRQSRIPGRDRLDVGQHGGAGGGEAGHRLEQRLGGLGIAPEKQVRERADQRDGRPGEGDHRERLAEVDVLRHAA
jgi:hypothetical protein